MCGVDEFQPRRNNRVLRIADIANQNNEDASIEIRYDEGFNANNLLEEMERSRDEEGHVTLDYFDCVLPTSSYYYGALSLIIDNWDPDVFDVHSYRNIIDSFAKTIELACLSINQYTDEQWARLSDYVWEASKVLKTIVNLYFDEDFDKLDDYIDEVHDFFDEVVFEDLRALYQNNLSDVLEVLSILYNKCVALAYPVYEKCRCTENCFFSLSGAKDDYTGTCYANQGWSATGLANNYVLVNTLINHFFGFNFTDCHLVDNC